MTGWNLPPGCNVRDIPGCGDDEPCQCCGHDPADCICPECPTCGEQGNPKCYEMVNETSLGENGDVVITLHGHGLHYNKEQRIGQAKMRIAMLKDRINDEELYLAWVGDQPEDWIDK